MSPRTLDCQGRAPDRRAARGRERVATVGDAHGTEQPFLHELVTCLSAPYVAISSPDGQLRAHGAQGYYDGDIRVLSRLEVTVDGAEAESLGHALAGVGSVEFVGVLRRLGDAIPDPTVALTRSRHVGQEGLRETVCLRSYAASALRCRIQVDLGTDLATMTSVKSGQGGSAVTAVAAVDGLRWRGVERSVSVRAAPAPDVVDAGAAALLWDVDLPPRGSVELTLTVSSASHGSASRRSAATFRPVAVEDAATTWSAPFVTADDRRLVTLLEQGLLDAEALLVGDPDSPGDRFLAAGSPWFLTLFGRDSIWAARMMLPLGTELARGTLAALARRQGTRVDPATEEQPGKMLHEVRDEPMHVDGGTHLPSLYYGTVDATPLWVCLLADASRWGMPAEQVAGFLPTCEAALEWLVSHGDSDGDGFLEYVDSTGSGLANQGWKDSGDSIQWGDGRLASPPLALCEVQGYAYEAATAGADLLERFGRTGTDRWREWAERLRHRFRSAFWTEDRDGAFPAVALDRDKRRVDSLTSNIGHLLGTGLLDADECGLVARRLAGADMDSGYGLRTLSASAPRFGPLSYHGGAVWPHDTAIVVSGLARSGHHDVAASLVTGLLEAAPRFDFRLPELYGGTQRGTGAPLVAYPAACRPQAWAATAAVGVLQAVLGLRPDVPAGELVVDPLRPAVAGAVSARGLRLAGHELAVSVTAAGEVDVVGPVDIRVRTAPGIRPGPAHRHTA